MAQLNKIDIADVAGDLPVNLSDRLIDSHIQKAIDIDFENVVSNSLVLAIKALNRTDNSSPQLTAFFNVFFKPVWAYYSYARFLAIHGNNVTQFGFVNIVDENTRTIDNQTRAFSVANVQRDAAVYVTRMRNELKLMSYTFDTVSYAPATNEVIIIQRKFSIKAIK